MKEYYLQLFEYNHWANKLIFNEIKDRQNLNPKIYSIFSHTIIAQILWLNRIKKGTYEFKDFWQVLTIAEMELFYTRSTNDWIKFIRGQKEDGFQESCSYTNSKGIKYTNTHAQIITHVINHSTYHRAQVAILLRQENVNPPLTDYIAFFR
jgi:uncharacterized damage-inducible protein DinB